MVPAIPVFSGESCPRWMSQVLSSLLYTDSSVSDAHRAYSNPRPNPGGVPSASLSVSRTPIYRFTTKDSNNTESDKTAASDTRSVGTTSRKSLLQAVRAAMPVTPIIRYIFFNAFIAHHLIAIKKDNNLEAHVDS